MTTTPDRHFHGGIQPGTTAYTPESEELQTTTTRVRNRIITDLAPEGYVCKSKLAKDEIPGGLDGCQPDGGIWYDTTGRAVVAVESKYQGVGGNAHERWYKNHAIISHIYPGIRYLTFCSGKGFVPTVPRPYRGFGFALAREGKDPHAWNILHPIGVSFFNSEPGFADEFMYRVMVAAIRGTPLE